MTNHALRKHVPKNGGATAMEGLRLELVVQQFDRDECDTAAGAEALDFATEGGVLVRMPAHVNTGKAERHQNRSNTKRALLHRRRLKDPDQHHSRGQSQEKNSDEHQRIAAATSASSRAERRWRWGGRSAEEAREQQRESGERQSGASGNEENNDSWLRSYSHEQEAQGLCDRNRARGN